MSGHTTAHTTGMNYIRLGVATLLLSATLLVGCSDDDDPSTGSTDTTIGSDTDTNTGENMMTSDTDTMLAELAFADAADDARHRCLLDTFSEDAQAAGLGAYPALADRGTVSKTWCSASGEDANNCLRGYISALTGRGARAVSVFAETAPGNSVADYGYVGARNPEAGADWSIVLERRFGSGGSFSARFVPYVNDAKEFMHVVAVLDIPTFRSSGIEVTLPAGSSADERLQALSESPAAFSSLLGSELDALLMAWEARLQDTDSMLDESARSSALESARVEIARRQTAIVGNAGAMHALLSEQLTLDRCR